jgi:hypothetical protein
VSSVGEIVLIIIGLLTAVFVLDAAIRTFVLPRGTPVLLTWFVFRTLRRIFDWFARPAKTYEQRDRVMALYGPMALLALPTVSLTLILFGFTVAFYGLDHDGWRHAFTTSGSCLFTLGFDRPPSTPGVALGFLEAAIGLGVLALVISYLPTIYGAFSRREAAVTDLSVRAGTPPKPWEMLERAHLSGYLNTMDTVWESWMGWFTELSETHTSLSVLTFFRSPNPNRSWITSAGAVLDAASLRLSVLNVPFTPAAGLCIRSGYLALREVAGFYGYEFDTNPRPDGAISIAREEFDEVYIRLGAAGVPVRPDRDRAWRDFQGWRVNYDPVLISLAGLVMAPYGPWTSDRSLREPLVRRSPYRRRAQRVLRAGPR